MNALNCVETLVNSGDIPPDARIVSTNNKVVVVSEVEETVSRISSGASERDDPHDLGYSHKVAWLAGDTAPVVKPLSEQPKTSSGYVISTYPLLDAAVNLRQSGPENVYDMVREFGNALEVVEDDMTLRKLDVSSYVQERIEHMLENPHDSPDLVEYAAREVERMNREHPFHQLTANDPALIHGDFKSDNVVADAQRTLKAIDLDAAAHGPGQYDLASWRLRCELGDTAPIEGAVEIGRRTEGWNEDTYKALIGWKAISSISFTLRYEGAATHQDKVAILASSAISLGGFKYAPPGA